MTFLGALHTFDAALLYTLKGENSLLTLNPFYGLVCSIFGEVSPAPYFWASIGFTFILFGISCAVAFHDPIATFINKVISDAKLEENPADSRLESGVDAFEMISDSVTSNGVLLTKLNKQSESVGSTVNALRVELMTLGAKLGKLDTSLNLTQRCPSCGKAILPEYKMCPYCGEKLLFCVQISTVQR